MKKANYDRKNSTCFHLHGVYLGVKLIKDRKAERQLPKGWGKGGTESYYLTSTELHLEKWNSSEDG